MAHAAAEAHQTGALERRQRQKHARTEAHEARRAIGLGLDHAADRERDRSDREAITDGQAEAVEHLALDDRTIVGQQRAERRRRQRGQSAVERIALAHRLQLDQQAVAAGWPTNHGDQLAHAHHARARVQMLERRLGLRR